MAKESTAGGCCLSVFGLPFFAAGLFVLGIAYLGFQEQARVRDWPSTNATIDQVEIRVTGSGKNRSRSLHVSYSYTVDGQAYTSTQQGPGAGGGYMDQQERLERHRDTREPFPIAYEPRNPSNAYLFRELSVMGILGMPAFGLVFASIGAAISAAGVLALRAASRQARLKAEHPDRPWRHEDTFADFRVRTSKGATAAIVLVIVGIITGVFVSAFVALVFSDPKTPTPVRGFIGCFTLIPIFLLGGGIYALMRSWKYGTPTLHLKQLPLIPGTTLDAVIEVPGGLDARDGVTLVLRCSRSTTTGSGKHRHTKTDHLHEETVTVEESKYGQILGGGVIVPVKLALPDGQPDRDPDSNPSIAWTLSAGASTPGVDFAAEFALPVYKVEAARIEKREDPLPS